MNESTGPKISIITPSYNSASYIEKCLRSVIDQTYPNIEYIVMDGSSSDGTAEIVKKYGEKIKFISEKDKGQIDALRKGLNMATGEVITWLDSDNYYYSNDVIEKVAKAFRENPGVEIVLTDSLNHHEGSERFQVRKTKKISYELLRNSGNKFIPESIFYTKSLYEKAGGINTDLLLLADYDLWIRLFRESRNYIKLPIISAVYEVRAEALLRKHFSRAWRETFEIGRKYHRPLLYRIWSRVKFIKAWIRFQLVSLIRKNPAVYRFFVRLFK
ncbi:MAG: glycosyltransferase family 2 protein [Candidatus Pacebacteria bacterium]|nr:glycosyltransferase family 2 protein [Candidatus Paceibacterota bacterium]